MDMYAIGHRTARTTGVPQDLTDQVIEAFLRELSAAFTEAVPAPPPPHASVDTTGAFAPGAVVVEPPKVIAEHERIVSAVADHDPPAIQEATATTLPDGW